MGFGNTDPFEIIFVISTIMIVVGIFSAVIAPSLGVNTPSTPEFPSFASNLDWTVSLTNWSGIGSFFLFVGGLIIYFCAYLVWMISMVSVFFTLLGFAPVISMSITALVFMVFIGSLLMFIRGSGDSSK